MHPTMICSTMRYWRMRPDPRLRPLVLCYFLARPPNDGSLVAAPRPADGDELLLPDGHSEIVFTLDGAYERWPLGDLEQRHIMRQSYLIGGRSHSVLTHDLSAVTVAGVKLDPRALRWMIRTPLDEFHESTLSLRDLGDRGLLDLEDAIAHADTAQGVAERLDRYLIQALRDMPPIDQPVDHLLCHIQSSHGALPILQWVRDHGVDPRHLERRFRATVGMTPKRYARVIRFKHSYHEFSTGTPKGAALHLDGFYDQSHFNKEFRNFVGSAPSARRSATLGAGTNITDHLLTGELTRPARPAEVGEPV